MRAFEIHTFQGGKWKIDSVFDDRELAVFEAQRMEGSKRYVGVRVVEETFDESTQQVATRTIYKGTQIDNGPALAAAQEAAKRTAKGPRGAARGAQGGGRRGSKGAVRAKSSSSTGVLLALLGVIVVVGIGAVVALRFISGGM